MNAPEKRPLGQLPPTTGPGHPPRLRTWIIGGILLLLVLGGYRYFNSISADSGRPAIAAPVRVARVEKRDMPVVQRSLGAVMAFTVVEVSSRVQGTMEHATFKEGQFVKKGDLLFQIDPRPFEAVLAQTEAIYRRDQAQLQNALRDQQRYGALMRQGAISTQQRDTADTSAAVMSATVAADKAAMDTARLNLEFTQIRSPIDGKTGAIQIQPGNLVSGSAAGGSSPPLVEIAQVRPVKVSFTLPQSDLPRIQARLKTGRLLALLNVQGRGGAPLSAPVNFTSDAVSNQTGTIELRATFTNDDLALVPGQLINVTVQLNDIPNALVVPRDAVNNGPYGTFVFTVKDGQANEVPVSVLTDDGTNEAVSGALAAGDTVVVEGQLRVVPGGAVRVISAPGAPSRAPSPGGP
ncbi:MAG TPA: efflux RND transporter periplasmic adaptor subunit [Rhizomicrobium sp.]|nr:efflux RND transporter periplasmic adaptor subunit [Rhizomicrobium sp.]